MPGTLTIPYAIGEECWYIGPGHREIEVPCPDCAGSKRVTLVRGDGTQVSLECNTCQLGYDPPRGFITRTIYECRPRPFIPRRVEVRGDEVTYSASGPEATCFSTVRAEDMFTDRDECAKACEQRNQEHAAEEAAREMANIKSKHRSQAHALHYHGGCIKRLERELEHHRRKWQEIDAKAKARKGKEA